MYQVGHEHALSPTLVEGLAHLVEHRVSIVVTLQCGVNVGHIALDSVCQTEAVGHCLGAYAGDFLLAAVFITVIIVRMFVSGLVF